MPSHQMSSSLSVIQQTLTDRLQGYSTHALIIACSGGVDSIVLLHEISALVNIQKITNEVTVCYVDHGLSDNAKTWHNFVKTQCEQLGLVFIGKQVHLNKEANQSLEAQARNARYNALKEVSGENGVVITAHHQDDQVETFLLALKRGAGIKGLGAMASYTTLHTARGKLAIVRPLLAVSRQEIEKRAQQLKLTWIEDESNTDQQFDRNFLRQAVVPLLSQRWSGINKAVARTAGHCQDAQQLLDEVASADLQQCLTATNGLSISQLLSLSASRFNYVIRYYLEQEKQLMPSSHVLTELRQQLFSSQDKTPQVKVGTKWLRRYQETLMLTDNFADISAFQQRINLSDITLKSISLVLPDSLGRLVFSLARDKQDELAVDVDNSLLLPQDTTELIVTFNHSNPVCLPDFRQHSRALKKVLQELNIPPWQRKRTPLVFCSEPAKNDQLVSAVGHFVCQPYSPQYSSGLVNAIKVNVRWLASDNSG